MRSSNFIASAPQVNCRAGAPPATLSASEALALQIKNRARELGFDLVGITTADSPPHTREFQRWLAENFHGEMAYMQRGMEKRADLRSILPETRSLIVVGMNYFTENRGPIARYARFARDYHDVLREKLQKLAEFLRELGAQHAKIYVDTGPILERDLAQRAGIGFIGKHTNLISRKLGNWIFIGEILTDLELPPDSPERAHCGTCRRCMDACPTNAIVAPYKLDARRCISYLTIELKGAIPEEFREKIGARIFGCDDCLEVCPWNRFAKRANESTFSPRADLEQVDLLEFLALDEENFRKKFRGTPIFRIKRRGFLRNVCVALGNVGDESALPALGKAARDSEPLIAEHARWAISRIRARTAAGRCC
jgi:epoxyqueuosine reductase